MPVLNEAAPNKYVATRRGEIDMGTIIEFPVDAASRRLSGNIDGPPRQGSAIILILPVIRIERHADESGGRGPEEGTAPGRRRRRRARS
jgi:hypothetical protein